MSVIDNRELLFDVSAIHAAISCGSRVTRNLRLPVFDHSDIGLVPESQSLELTHNDGVKPGAAGVTIHHLQAPQIAALLIAYCMQAGIPVPRGGERSMRVHDTHVALIFTRRIAARI